MANILYLFTNDLRLQDNQHLQSLIESHQANRHSLTCSFIFDLSQLSQTNYNQRHIGAYRTLFLLQAIQDVACELIALGIKFELSIQQNGEQQCDKVKQLINQYQVTTVYCAQPFGINEQQSLHYTKQISKSLPTAPQWIEFNSFTLFNQASLPFELANIPDTFSKFRKSVERLDLEQLFTLTTLCDRLERQNNPHLKCDSAAFQTQFNDLLNHKNVTQLFNDADTTPEAVRRQCIFDGGESAALRHLESYFSSSAPSTYKTTRNELDEWASSTKFSPWLSIGCLSPRRIWTSVFEYEELHGANDSTYWIKFELLWREYFQWQALQLGSSLFFFGGKNNRKPLTSFYPERFMKWCEGNTPYPIVNAAMKQLNQTGYMSNRARQIVASCLIHELQLDWRYGAAYFQLQLVDYDVASNWGNWQYLAGVGFDPRGSRRFNIDKQTQTYDPDQVFINKWGGHVEKHFSLDSVDIADWPTA